MDAPKTIVLISGGIVCEVTKRLTTDNPSYHILMGRRSLPRGEVVIASLSKFSLEPIDLDAGTDASIMRTLNIVRELYGNLNALINNAGIFRCALPKVIHFEDNTPKQSLPTPSVPLA